MSSFSRLATTTERVGRVRRANKGVKATRGCTCFRVLTDGRLPSGSRAVVPAPRQLAWSLDPIFPIMLSDEILKRKGASRACDVPPAVLDLLSVGAIESVNLTEWLLVDHVRLAHTVLPDLGLESALPLLESRLAASARRSALRDTQMVAEILIEHVPQPDARAQLVRTLAVHPSDSSRGWGAYLIGFSDELPLAEKLKSIRSFAADPHFGVREVAWMAVRPSIAAELDAALELLVPWVYAGEANIRRFASELTRPRGVWCSHIERLKRDAEPALVLLEPLRSDPSKYVRDSVGNWLNDASKSQPDWVRGLCTRWSGESDTAETRYIVNRALRTLRA